MIEARTIVIGAGPAGLAVAACLRRQHEDCLILERSDSVGSSWRRHYDRLHLHTDKRHSSLPYFALPHNYPRYPSRDQVVAYLEGYAARFGLTPSFGQEVVSAARHGGAWHVHTSSAQFSAPNLVIATGLARQPVMPDWAGLEDFRGTVMHSSAYASGEPYRGQRVLVVGAGNSGAEIALDLHQHRAKVDLAVRSPVTVIVRDPFGLPFLDLAVPLSRLPPKLADALTKPLLRLLLGDRRGWGLPSDATGPFTRVARDGRIPLIDIGTLGLIRSGALPVRSAIDRFSASTVHFTDGSSQEYDAVVLATGYRPALEEFLDVPVSRQATEGLFFCGFDLVATGMLRQIGREARMVAAQIARSRAATARAGTRPVT